MTLEGFVGDTATTVPVGKVDEEKLKLIRVTEECLDRAIQQCRAGNHLGDIGWAVQEHAEANGYSVVRDYVGHGIGRRMHEDPQIPNYGRPGLGPKIKSGYVFAVEPMVNQGSHFTKVLADGWTVVTMDGKPSAHAEHTIAITEEGPEVLTLVASGTARWSPRPRTVDSEPGVRASAQLGKAKEPRAIIRSLSAASKFQSERIWRRKRR